jgi:hypothetical protein
MPNFAAWEWAVIGIGLVVAVALHLIMFGVALWLGRHWEAGARAMRPLGVVLSVLFGLAVLLNLSVLWLLTWVGLGWPLLRAARRLRSAAPEVAA